MKLDLNTILGDPIPFRGILEVHVKAENSTLVLQKIIRHSKLLFPSR